LPPATVLSKFIRIESPKTTKSPDPGWSRSHSFWGNTHGNLILDAADVEEGLDLLPQFVPGPGTELQVLAQIALDNLEGDALFLELLEALTGQVTTGPCLHPGHDLAQTLITELLHLTQDTGAEEHLFFFVLRFWIGWGERK